jgi:hypothetical protein
LRDWGRLLGWAGVLFLVGLIPLAVGWGELPDPVASHWGWNGEPDASMPLRLVPLLMVAMLGIALILSALFRVEGKPTAEAFALVGVLGGIGAALTGLLVTLNRGVTTWTEAGDFVLWHVGVVLFAASAGGLAGFLIGRRWYPQRPASRSVGPVMESGADERVSWIGRASVRWPLSLVGVGAVMAVVLPVWGTWLGGLLTLVALALMQVEARVDDEGLRVRLGVIPVRRIPLEKISSARGIDLEPTEWGGWGWRAVGNGSAIVLRRGAALEVSFRNGRRFAVTVDDAGTGAALINGLLARSVRGG